MLIHCDPEFTKEYDDVNCKKMDEIPGPQEWIGEEKTLVVCDDLEYQKMSSDQLRNLSRLFGFVSTHKNISVCLTSQDPFTVPAAVRRCANVWVLWRIPDLDAMSVVARRTGMSASKFKQIFDQLLKGPNDSLWVDLTKNSTAPLRKNGFDRIVAS